MIGTGGQTITDNEIIKALECCRTDNCDECPCDLTALGCDLEEYALNLINRQKAEIERLEKENKLLIDCNPANRYSNCVLVKNCEVYTKTLEDYDKLLADISAEAIKEFAERLKEYREIVSYDRDFDAYVYGSHIHIDIDEFENLVKEIAGEQ